MMATDTKKRKWIYKDKKMSCCSSEESSCKVSKLWEVAQLTSFHDAELQQATSEINAVLDELKKGNKDRDRHLSFIAIKGRHFLVWTSGGVVGPDDDDKTISKMLRLKQE